VKLMIAAAALTMPVAASAAPAVDWSRTVVKTAAGGFQMGNPKARVKLIEYGSLACPHCRHFEQTGYKPLVRGYVRTGKVSYEFRNLLLNSPDLAVSLLAHCAGAAKFFPMSEVVFATQPTWFQKVADLTDDQRAAMVKMTSAERTAAIGQTAGFPQIAARFGVTPLRAKQCYADPKGTERLLAMSKAAIDNGIASTPTFLVNGTKADASTWEELEPLLKKAGG